MKGMPFGVGRFLEQSIDRVRRIYLVRGVAVVGIVWVLGIVAVMVADSRVVIFDDRIRWAMTAGVWLLALVAAMLAIVLPLRRRLDFRRMAMILDQRHPEHEERLSTLVELSESDASKAGFSASLFALVCDLAEDDVARLDFRREFPMFAALRRFGVFALLALALGIGSAVSPNLVGRLFVRAVAPWSDIGNLFSDEIAVKPGDLTILSGSVIRIEAKSAKDARPEEEGGAFSIRISRKTPLGWSEETVEEMSGGVYETTADLNERVWRYRVTAGHAVTRYYHVRVSQMPKYDLFTATVRYPDYTGMPPLVLSNSAVTAIKAIEGSRVKFDVKVSDPGTLVDFRIGKEPLFEHTMVSNRTTGWSLDLVNEDGFRAEKGRHPLTSCIDQPPTVLIEKPTGTLRLPPHAKIPVEITGTDDIGIRDAYMRVSIDNEPWERHYGTKIDCGAGAAFLRTVADVDLSLYDLIFAKNIRFDVVVTDGCPPEFGGPHSATSTPFTVQFAADEANYAMQELKQEVASARRDLDEARKRLNDAQQLARQVRDELRRDQKVSAATEEKNERLAHELDEAESRVSELRDEFLSDERFAPLTRPLDRILDETLKPLLEEVENSQFRDRDERADAISDAMPEMEKAVQELDDFAKRLQERAAKVDAFEKAKDLAARQDALAKAADELTRERPLDTAKLEAWKRLEEAAMRKADELARQDPDSDISEAKRKMETAAREMARLKQELESAAAESNRLAKAEAKERADFREEQRQRSQELAKAVADGQQALDAIAQTNLAAAAKSQQAAQNHLQKSEALPAVKALQDLAAEATKLAAEKQAQNKGEAVSSPLEQNEHRLAQDFQKAAAEAAKAEQALREALANPTNRVGRQALENLDRRLRAELPKRQAALNAAKGAMEKAKSDEAAKKSAAEKAAKAAEKEAARIADLASAAAAQAKAQKALDDVAAARAEAAKDRSSSDAPLDQKHQSALAAKEKAAAEAANDAAAAQKAADDLLKRGEATEGAKAMQKLANKAAAASQKAPHDVGRAQRAAAAQKAASKALGDEKALREALASGEKTAADLEAFDRATQAAAKRQSAAFDRAEQSAAERDKNASGRNSREAQDLGQAVADQKRAAGALQQAAAKRAEEARAREAKNQAAAEARAREAQNFERQAAEAQRAAEDRLERSGATEGVKALQQLATTATRNARRTPQTKEKFDLAAAAQKAAAEALQNELKVREGIRKGEMTEDDLAALDDQLKEGLLKMAGERTEAAKAAADAAIRKAKDVVGTEEDDQLGRLADAALEAARDAVSSQLSESKLKNDEAQAAALRDAEDALDAITADAAEEQSVEARIRGLQQSAADALARNDRNRAMNLQKEIANAQARAADNVNEEDEAAARTAANAAQAAAAEAIEKAYRNWNNGTKEKAIAAQKAAIERELEAQDEAQAVRALSKLGAAEKSVAREAGEPSEPSEQADQPNSSQPAAKAATDAADALDREVNAQAAALGMSRQSKDAKGGKGKGEKDDKKLSSGGGIADEVSHLASELKRNDSPDFLKSLFTRLGWFKIRGLSKDGLVERDLKDVPREYRDLVRRYFLKLAEENP